MADDAVRGMLTAFSKPAECTSDNAQAYGRLRTAYDIPAVLLQMARQYRAALALQPGLDDR